MDTKYVHVHVALHTTTCTYLSAKVPSIWPCYLYLLISARVGKVHKHTARTSRQEAEIHKYIKQLSTQSVIRLTSKSRPAVPIDWLESPWSVWKGHHLTLYMRMTTIVVINFTKNDF